MDMYCSRNLQRGEHSSLFYRKWQGTACFHTQISSAARLEVQLRLGGTEVNKCPSDLVEKSTVKRYPVP